MAVNRSRSMNDELRQGIIDGSYMQLAPNRGGDGISVDYERMDWPTYARVEDTTSTPFDMPRYWRYSAMVEKM